jgi:hypothetical protein
MDNKQKAIDAEVMLSDGSTLHLSETWKRKPLLLVFLRHFG